jgi:hypothetical protein
MESPNTIQSCDPRSFIALQDFKGDGDNQLSIKANEEVSVLELSTNSLPPTANIQKI